MELGLSLGEAPTPFSFLDKTQKMSPANNNKKELGFCMALGNAFGSSSSSSSEEDQEDQKREQLDDDQDRDHDLIRRTGFKDGSADPVDVPLQLDLLPSVPVPRSHISSSPFRFSWLTHNYGAAKGFDVNRQPAAAVTEETTEDGVTISSPNSTLSSFHMDFCVRNSTSRGSGRNINNINIINNNNNFTNNKRSSDLNIDHLEGERASSRASDDEENGSTRKKLRLSKEQSAFLEESFKEHSTLNPKQKLALAKQLNLRPRQVEVWFQNRRARTKLKQTEVDCEYLKRCCETLTEENRRLQKELQELRALKTSQPFYMQLPATTLTMCPSCERVATANPAASAGATANSPPTLAVAKPILHPFSHHAQAGKAAASLSS